MTMSSEGGGTYNPSGGTAGFGTSTRGPGWASGANSTARSPTYSLPYPIVYGTATVKGVPLTVLDKGDHPLQMAGGSGPTETVRTAEVQYAFCYGQTYAIEGLVYEKRWYGSGGIDEQYLSWNEGGAWQHAPVYFVGDGTATTWAHYASSDVTWRIAWPMLTYMRCRYFGVPGGSGTVPEIRALVRGKYASNTNNRRGAVSGWTNIQDAAPGDIIRDLVENTTYGLGLPAGTVVTAAGADGAVASSYDTYCAANNWWLALAIDRGTSILDVVEQILTATNSIAVWTDASKLKIVPLGDTAVGTYSPVLTALEIGDDDIVMDGRSDPVTVRRRPWSQTFNCIPVEYSGDTKLRDAEMVIVEDMDAANSSLFGVRRGETVSLPCVRSAAHAKALSGIFARRSCFHRAVFELALTPKLGAQLEPGDLVLLFHVPMGLDGQLARVESVDEDADGNYRITAREWVTGSTIAVESTPQLPEGLQATPTASRDVYAAATDGTTPTAILDAFESTGGTVRFLREDGSWATGAEDGSWDDIQGPALQAGGAAALTQEAFGDVTDFQALFMRSGQVDKLSWAFQLPHRWGPTTDVKFHVHIVPMASPASSQVILFEGAYAWSRPGVAVAANASWTTFSVQHTVDTTDGLKQAIVPLFTATPPVGASESAVLMVRFQRTGNSATDTYSTSKSGGTASANVCVLTADVHYRAFKNGTESEF